MLLWSWLWTWSDTCCIDKHGSAEVQETMGSMFTWYRQSALTVVYLCDVPDTGSVDSSEWFRRGWTLQELLAPDSIVFYTKTRPLYRNLTSLHHKADAVVLEELERVTGTERRFFKSFSPGLDDACLILQWASQRTTTRPEDSAYSLSGILNLHLPVMHGESAENALGLLLAEVVSHSGDISVLDWVGASSPFHSCFPADITSYQILQSPPSHPSTEGQFSATSEGLSSIEVLRNIWRSPTTVPAAQPQTPVLLRIKRCVRFPLTCEGSPCVVLRSPAYTTMHRLSCHIGSVERSRSVETELYAQHPGVRADTTWDRDAGQARRCNEVTRRSHLYLVRPWHSKILGPFTDLDALAEEQLVSVLRTHLMHFY